MYVRAGVSSMVDGIRPAQRIWAAFVGGGAQGNRSILRPDINSRDALPLRERWIDHEF
jgi:hypothetical protein